MKKYKVTYDMVDLYGSKGGSEAVAQYTVEFIAEECYSYDVADALRPTSTINLRWMIGGLTEVKDGL